MDGAGPDTPYSSHRWRALPVLLSATFMAVFDLFAVNVAVPSIQHDLHTTSGELELVVAGYSLAYAAFLVTGGRLGDLYGRRRLFMAGVAVFSVASLLCGLAPGAGLLIAARLLQGVGAAMMTPQVLATINLGFPDLERPRALGWFGLVFGGAVVAGQVLGGALVQLDAAGWGWRTIFLVNVPVGLAALAGALWLVPDTRTPRAERLDPVGLGLLVVGLVALLTPIVLGHSEGWPVWTWLSLGAAAVVLGLFVAYEHRLERRGGWPLLRVGHYRPTVVKVGLAVNLAFFGYLGSFMFVVTLFLQDGLHQSPLHAGLTFAPFGVGFAVGALVGRVLGTRGAPVLPAGSAATAAGVAVVMVVVIVNGAAGTTAELAPALAVVGLGGGLVFPSLTGASLAGAPPGASGAVAGALVTTQHLGSALGVALVGLLFFHVLAGAGPADALVAALACEVVVMTAAAVLSTRLGPGSAGVPAPAPAPAVPEPRTAPPR
ncbi:MAG TPA: MFS transporter [Acidimicrobiales bacterium]|nr:MFS transporter [Acidimicrobiales bacterium]